MACGILVPRPRIEPMLFTMKAWRPNHGGVCACAQSLQLSVTPWTVARQAPLSMGFPRQEYWSRLPLTPPGDLPNPGIEPRSLASSALQADSLPLSHQGNPQV